MFWYGLWPTPADVNRFMYYCSKVSVDKHLVDVDKHYWPDQNVKTYKCYLQRAHEDYWTINSSVILMYLE